MHRPTATLCLLLAWICANGAVWDAVQVVAWSRMFWSNAQTAPVAQALERTFDGRRPCSLCVAVVNAKASERQQAPATTDTGAPKIVFVCEAVAAPIFVAPMTRWPESPAQAGPEATQSVPVPPPRHA